MWSLIRDPKYWKTKFSDAIFLGSVGSISGTVFLSGGVTPAPGVLVRLCPGGLQTLSLGDGSYSILGVPQGTYKLLAFDKPQAFEGSAQITVVRSANTSQNLTLATAFKGC